MTSALTVLQLVPDLQSGGVERGTLEVADELVRRGHRSLVISGGGRLVDRLCEAGSEHFAWPIGRKSPLTLGQVFRLRQFIVKQSVDIVHARSRVPAWVAHFALKSLQKKKRPAFITTVHGLNSVNRYSEVMTFGETVIAVSNTAKQYIQSHYPNVPAERIQVVHRGIDRDYFSPSYQPSSEWRGNFFATYPQLEGKTLIALPGRLTRLKGHAELLKLMCELKTTHPDLKALIVGGEDPRRLGYARELRQQVRDLGIESSVLFLGHRDDVREVLAISDVVLSLSGKPESFGRTVLEALSLGTPVVGFDHGGVGEILSELFPAGLVPLGNSQALAACVNRMLADTQAVAPSNRFNLQTMLDRIMNVYEQATSTQPNWSAPKKVAA